MVLFASSNVSKALELGIGAPAGRRRSSLLLASVEDFLGIIAGRGDGKDQNCSRRAGLYQVIRTLDAQRVAEARTTNSRA